MASGRMPAEYGVSGGTVVVTPTQPLHQGERVCAIATAGLRGLDGTPAQPVEWCFTAGQVRDRCVGKVRAVPVGPTGIRPIRCPGGL